SSTLLSSTHPLPPALYTLSLHDALPISPSFAVTAGAPPTTSRLVRSSGPIWASRFADAASRRRAPGCPRDVPTSRPCGAAHSTRSEEHTSELQSPYELVCRPLLEKKK